MYRILVGVSIATDICWIRTAGIVIVE